MTLYGLPNNEIHDDGGSEEIKLKILAAFPDAEVLDRAPEDYEVYIYGEGCSHECEKHISNRVSEVKALLIEKYSVNAPYTYSGTERYWQVDKESQDNIGVGTDVAIMSTVDAVNFPWEGDDTDWCDADNVMVTFLTALDFLQFAKAMQVHCRAIWKTAKIHKTAIRLLTDETEINNYDITTGW